MTEVQMGNTMQDEVFMKNLNEKLNSSCGLSQ